MRVACLASILIAAAALAACGRSQDGTAAAPPAPADAPPAAADVSRPLNAIGTEPFWSLRIRSDGLTFSAPGQADVTAPASVPAVAGATARWTGTGSDGKPLTVSLAAAACSDGMSDAVHPFTAAVEAGGRSLKGCAAYAAAD